MNLTHRQRRIPAVLIGALAAIGVITTVIRGSTETAVLVVLVATLLVAYFVRHRVRARLMYERRADSAKAQRREADAARTRAPSR